MSKEELLQLSKDEISVIAKGLNITLSVCNKRKTKDQLIDEILVKAEAAGMVTDTDVISAIKDEVSQDDDSDWQAPESNSDESLPSGDIWTPDQGLADAEREAKKKAYIENVKIGTLVAFKSITGKIKSAKVTKRSTKNRKLKVETKYGAEFVISYDDVIWVRTNKRWPKGVYQLLKGVTNNEEAKG